MCLIARAYSRLGWCIGTWGFAPGFYIAGLQPAGMLWFSTSWPSDDFDRVFHPGLKPFTLARFISGLKATAPSGSSRADFEAFL
jgi:hypothetical protein